MIFTDTALKGACIIEPEQLSDKRGFFARTWCQKEFLSHGLNPNIVQSSISYNRKKGTLRGMHYQAAPYEEAKLIRCTKGAIYAVIIDLRSASDTYIKWVSVEMKAADYRMIYVPEENCAFGFLTLEDDTEIFYLSSEFYTPEAERGVRWNDPLFRITWPTEVSVISNKDNAWPDFFAEKR
jgi:dTDP-4-dehydrorhamnose 3,5-epimerase